MDVNTIITKLTALKMLAKNIHYRCTSYQVHLLADKLAEATDKLDDLKERAFLANREFPLLEQEYASKATELVPEVSDNERETLISAFGFIDTLRKDLNGFKTDAREVNALLDEVAGDLATVSALIHIQARVTPGLNEAELEHCPAATETPVDREEPKMPDLQKIMKANGEPDLSLVAEESVLDKLAEKLGV